MRYPARRAGNYEPSRTVRELLKGRTLSAWLESKNRCNLPYSSEEWSFLTSHERGHAIGFGHELTADQSKTIMTQSGPTEAGTPPPRMLDQCGSVRSFPSPSRSGDVKIDNKRVNGR